MSDFKYLNEKNLVYNDERGRNIGHTFIRTIKFVERGWTNQRIHIAVIPIVVPIATLT